MCVCDGVECVNGIKIFKKKKRYEIKKRETHVATYSSNALAFNNKRDLLRNHLINDYKIYNNKTQRMNERENKKTVKFESFEFLFRSHEIASKTNREINPAKLMVESEQNHTIN